MGYDYYYQKITFLVIEIILPIVFLIFFGSGLRNLDTKLLLHAFETLSVLIAILLLSNAYQIGINEILQSKFMTRVEVGESNVIWTGRFISFGFLIILFRKTRLIYKVFTLPVLLLALVLTGSKSVLLFPLITIVIYFLFILKNDHIKSISKKTFLIYIGLIVLGISTIFSFLNPEAVETRFSIGSGTVDTRKSAIDNVMDEANFRENYFFGNGFATSGFPIVGTYNQRYYPHNITVEIFYELGFLGVFLFFLLIFIPLWLYKKHKIPGGDFGTILALYCLVLFYSQTSGDLTGNSLIFVFSGYIIYSMNYWKSIGGKFNSNLISKKTTV